MIFVLPACSVGAAAALNDAMKIAKMNRYDSDSRQPALHSRQRIT